jgi:hypothetical protein
LTLCTAHRSRSQQDWSVHSLPVPTRGLATPVLTWASLPGDQLSARTFARTSTSSSTAATPSSRHGLTTGQAVGVGTSRCTVRRVRAARRQPDLSIGPRWWLCAMACTCALGTRAWLGACVGGCLIHAFFLAAAAAAAAEKCLPWVGRCLKTSMYTSIEWGRACVVE